MLIELGWQKDFINKMDCEFANKQARYDATANEIKQLLIKVGWQKDGRGGWRAQEPGWWLNARPRSAPPGTWTSTP